MPGLLSAQVGGMEVFTCPPRTRILSPRRLALLETTTLGPIRCSGWSLHVCLLLGLMPASPAGLMGLAVSVWVLVVALKLAFGNPDVVSARPEQASRG